MPGNTPYTRYFLAHILQFQFHRDLCAAIGYEGPLHRCSIYGEEEAGRRLRDMMAMGLSRPWPEALEAMGGSRGDGRHGDPRLLRPARRLAQGAERRPVLRLELAAC